MRITALMWVALAACHHGAGDVAGPPQQQQPQPQPHGQDTLQTRWAAHQTTGVAGPGRCATTDAELDKTCSADRDCVVITQVLDKCMTTAHLGVNARGQAAFAARPAADFCPTGECPSCNVRWQFTEDCSPVEGRPVATCVSGRCMTHAS